MKTNTLKSAAEKFNMYSAQDVPQEYREQSPHIIERQQEPVPDINTDNFEVGYFYECRIQDAGTPKETKYIDHCHLLIKALDSDLLLMLKKDWKTKKYYLYPYYDIMYAYQNINHNLRQEAVKDLKEPNKIGVFTEKKLIEWAKYCRDYVQAHEQLLTSVNDANQAIEKEIKDFIDSIPYKQVNAHGNTTYIKTDYFSITLTHNRESKYLDKRIQFNGGLDAVKHIENAVI
jgi:hypothetical protein